MQIFIVDSQKNNVYFGDSKDFPIPRIGEKVYMGYNPASIVTDVIYTKSDIYVCIDGFILNK